MRAVNSNLKRRILQLCQQSQKLRRLAGRAIAFGNLGVKIVNIARTVWLCRRLRHRASMIFNLGATRRTQTRFPWPRGWSEHQWSFSRPRKRWEWRPAQRPHRQSSKTHPAAASLVEAWVCTKPFLRSRVTTPLVVAASIATKRPKWFCDITPSWCNFTKVANWVGLSLTGRLRKFPSDAGWQAAAGSRFDLPAHRRFGQLQPSGVLLRSTLRLYCAGSFSDTASGA
jgi:hypothetical protein